MNKKWESQIKQSIKKDIESIEFSQLDQNRILTQIHDNKEMRRQNMRAGKKKFAVIFAAVLVAMGTITAIGAGKVTSLISSVGVEDEIYSVAEFKAEAKKQMGADIKVPETLMGGNTFEHGTVISVVAMDEQGNKVGSYPNASAHYEGSDGIVLGVMRAADRTSENESSDQVQQDYQGITLRGKEDAYLFLPPDAQPSEADLQLQEEGKLMISYGSDTEQREVFKHVGWTDGELDYMLYTFGDVEMTELMGMAKEVIGS